MGLGSDWFTEIDARSGTALSFRIRGLLHDEQTPFQRIEIYDTTDFGHLMVIDGCVMLTTRENYLYHEVMAHCPLLTHADPQAVAIVGGGDCGTLREVLKHSSVQSVTQIEIDERVTRLSEQYFPELCEANDDPRAQFVFDDAVAWMANAEEDSLDVIIVDSTDPIGPGEGLFNVAFYSNCRRALRPNGLLIQQSESPLIHRQLHLDMRQAMGDAGFVDRHPVLFPQPCYPSGWWSGTLAATGLDLTSFRSIDVTPLKTQYYNAATHRAALAIPQAWIGAAGDNS
ncbi:MAG: polyamine aminopropyltransferase [Lysobacteraceae bacterium]|nr:MAG: polyamine aminopropyltransferase [Xanthomonadaceae bacterium]